MKRVLIIEDEVVIRIGFEKLLKKRSCIIDKVRSFQEALIALDNFSYDLILLDLVIPPYEKESGFNIIKKLKEKKLNQATPIVIISGKKSEEEIKKRIHEDDNVVDVLIKPVQNDKLLEAVEKVLGPCTA
ncbi:MAG: response regulator [candidate division KSB1 bacterium]|nr:response regulator [candidate division KSB1 bacterium]MDZ7346642.1 response regulator [candidate division KSB1 bacterium]